MNFQYSIQNNQCSIKNGFRQMDVQLGRWHVVDAMAEKYMSTSSYAYTMNDPINHTDLKGLQAIPMQYWTLRGELQGPVPNGRMEYSEAGGGGWVSVSPFAGMGLGFGSSFGGSNIFNSGPTGAAYDAFIAMGGGGDGSSFGAWYGAGGRDGMSLGEYGAINNVLNNPNISGYYSHVDGYIQSLTIDGIGTFDFNGNVKVSSVVNNAGGDNSNNGHFFDEAGKYVSVFGLFSFAEYAIKLNELAYEATYAMRGATGKIHSPAVVTRYMRLQAFEAANCFKKIGVAAALATTAIGFKNITSNPSYSNIKSNSFQTATSWGAVLVPVAAPYYIILGIIGPKPIKTSWNYPMSNYAKYNNIPHGWTH